jgi:hypothetical protein
MPARVVGLETYRMCVVDLDHDRLSVPVHQEVGHAYARVAHLHAGRRRETGLDGRCRTPGKHASGLSLDFRQRFACLLELGLQRRHPGGAMFPRSVDHGVDGTGQLHMQLLHGS